MDLGSGWQAVHPECLATLLEMVVLTAAQHAWPLSALPLPAMCDALERDGYAPGYPLRRGLLPAAGRGQPGHMAATSPAKLNREAVG